MKLYIVPNDLGCQRVAIVLREKGLEHKLIDVSQDERLQAELVEANSYGSVPTLVDQKIVLHKARVILPYLDRRYPSPPLMPIEPLAEAQLLQALSIIEDDWYPIFGFLRTSVDERQLLVAKASLASMLDATMPVFAARPYFLSDEFTLVDATLAPLLARLPKVGIALKKSDGPLQRYIARVTSRPSFAL